MKFVKVKFFGKEYYKPVGDDYTKGEVIELVEPTPEPENKAKAFFERVGSEVKNLGTRVSDGAKQIGGQVADNVKRISEKVKNGTLFEKERTTEEKLLSLLPYMDTKSRHELCERLLSGDETLCRVDVEALLPFFEKEDCDALFIRAIESGNTGYNVASIAPYVSRRCYREIVDKYIDGALPYVSIDDFYPYLSDVEIKRIFHHIANEG